MFASENLSSKLNITNIVVILIALVLLYLNMIEMDT